ncbi:MAG: hypothetical protein J5935_03320 [Lachnospiraceae bacterium]|nr:hypothetical protein [Lachnospiraceae bacterium]
MELQIKDLVSSIRKDGIDAANAEAESILAEARQKAASIIEDAKEEAKQHKDATEKEIDILKESAKVGAEQAKRDAVLSFKAEIQKEFEKILAADVRKEFSGESLTTLIRAAMAEEDVGEYAVEIAEVSEELKQQLAEEIRNGLEIRPSKEVQQGFRLSAKDGSGFFDCSDEAIMEMLMPYFRELEF